MAARRCVLRVVPVSCAAALLLALGLGLATGCSGSNKVVDEVTVSTVEKAATSTTLGAGPLTAAEVAPELAVFGELAAVEAPPVTARFDSAGGRLDLADGAWAVVPPGAFAEDTSLTVTIVGLALNYFDSQLGPARTYAIETDREIQSLTQPVILEIPFPPEACGMAVLEDGEWVALELPPGDTIRIEISHFSKTLITFLPAGIEWLVEKGWTLGKWTNWGIPGAFAVGAQEQVHQGWVTNQADQSTRDFYGLDENGEYVPPTHTQQEMCQELQTLIADYVDFSLPDDYDGYRLSRYLFDAQDPAQQKTWSEFWDYTRDSMATINRQVLDSSAPLTPAQVLKIAIDASGGNVPMGLLAAHNYLKNLAYLGREFADPGKLDEDKMPVAPRPVPPLTGQPVAHLEPWRQAGPDNPSGRLDKVGSLYHIFAAAVAGSWGYEWVDSGEIATAGEALLRAGLGTFAGDVPDREKGLADECGERIGGAVMARATGREPPTADAETPQPKQDADGIRDGAYVGEVYPILKAGAPIWAILESEVELWVTDDGVAASVEYVQRWTARGTVDTPKCIATIRMLYAGQGPVNTSLSLVLTPIEAEIISIEGSDCDGLEETLLAGFAKKQTRTLFGTFNGGLFDGDLDSVHGVKAAISE